MSDQFLGAWLVSEYVYNANGRFAGIIKQRRELRRLANGRIQVLQQCEPAAELAGHPMSRFAGEWVFELSIDGRYRRYHGPAVVGTGVPWGEGAMTGSGLWPNFGHNFRSFSVMPTAERQLTGGTFLNATEMVANIAGVAMPEEAGADWPQLNRYYYPQATVWQGSLRTVLANGTVVEERPFTRTFETVSATALAWQEDGVETKMKLENGRFLASSGEMQGIGKLYGPLLETEMVGENGRSVTNLELLDTIQGHLIGLRHWKKDGVLEKVEVLRLKRD